MKKEAVILGYSGHAYVVLDILLENNYSISGYCEKTAKSFNPYNISYLGCETDEEVFNSIKHANIFVGLGDNNVRKTIIENLDKNCKLPYLIHPTAFVSKKATIDFASIIMPGVIVNSLARIGKGVICNSSSVIEHECHIGDYVHMAPGAVLAGSVRIGNNSFIGANSVIMPGVKIGEHVLVGAGSVVTKDIENGKIVVGNPAKDLK